MQIAKGPLHTDEAAAISPAPQVSWAGGARRDPKRRSGLTPAISTNLFCPQTVLHGPPLSKAGVIVQDVPFQVLMALRGF